MGAAVTAEPKSKSKAEVSAEHAEPAPSAFDLEAAYGAPAGMPLFLANGLQCKLAVGAVDDPLEREADQVAERVMRSVDGGTGLPAASQMTNDSRTEAGLFAPPPSLGNHPRAELGVTGSAIQRKCACGGSSSDECEECRKREEEVPTAPVIQRRTSGNGNSAGGTDAPAIVHQALRSPGQPLDTSVRPLVESRFGRDFGDVRVHTDSVAAKSAQAINALAYTSGKDVVFGAGEYAPGTQPGMKLLAHELAHTIQQSDMPQPAGLEVAAPGDPTEQEAQAAAQNVAAGDRATPKLRGHGIARQPAGTQPPSPAPPAPAPIAAGPPPAAAPAPLSIAAPPPTPSLPTAPPTTPAPAGGTPVSPVPAAAPSTATEIVLPPETLSDLVEIAIPIYSTGLKIPLWVDVILLPPPFFAVTVALFANLKFKLELLTRMGPAVLRNIRLVADPTASRYSGTAEFYMPVVEGPQATLTASLSGETAWLGLVELLAIEGGLKAIGTALDIVAVSNTVNVIYDSGSFTFSVTPALDVGTALTFDLNAFLEARLLEEKVWSKTWNLFHWQSGRAFHFGSTLSLDYIHGALQNPRSQPFAEEMPIEQLLHDAKSPAEGNLEVLPPGKVPLHDRLQQLLGVSGSDPQQILAALAAADDREKAAVLGDPSLMSSLEGAVGNALWPLAQRILTNAPSVTVPSLDEGTVFMAERHIHASRFQDALYVIVSRLQARGVIDSSLARFAYARETTKGEALTSTSYDRDPATGNRLPIGPSEVEIYDPAFVSVPWLYSSIMHEYVHVLQMQKEVTPSEWSDPEKTDRGEVEAYLWEIEHARGTGVIVSPAQMEDLGHRLTDHFNKLSAPTQTVYQTRYDDAMKQVKDATSGVSPVNVTYTIEDARKIVQDSSREIAKLVRERAVAAPGDIPRIDAEIAAIQKARTEALVEVVLAENPNVQIVDRAKGIYRVPVKDGAGLVQWLYGSIYIVWHLHQVAPDVFTIGASIGSQPPATLPPGTSVSTRMLVGGSGIQSRVQPYPGDVDFSEEFDIAAPTASAAGAAMAETIAEFVARTSTDPNVEFLRLRVMPVKKDPKKNYVWDRARILDPGQRAELATQLADSGGGRINTDWRALLSDGRFVEVTKVLGVHALSTATGATLFATQPSGAEFQEAYLDEAPPQIEPMTLGAYAQLMRDKALSEAASGNYLKAAKRAFNYFRTIGDLEGMNMITPVFSTDQARVNQAAAVLEGISSALDPAWPTGVLTVDIARARMLEVADLIETTLPALPGRIPPRDIANELRAIASALHGTGGTPNLLAPDVTLKANLDLNRGEIKIVIGKSLESQVKPIIDARIR